MVASTLRDVKYDYSYSQLALLIFLNSMFNEVTHNEIVIKGEFHGALFRM
jgi:hypothetical protein